MWLKPKKENVVENNKETKNLVTIKCPGEMVPENLIWWQLLETFKNETSV